MDLTLNQLFPQFEPELIEKLKAEGQIIDFKAGDVLVRPGQYLKTSILVIEGRVKMYRPGKEGEEFFLYYLGPGNACALSLICCIKNEVSALKGRAMSSGKALLIPVQHMEAFMRDHRQWFYFLLDTYKSKFDELIEVIDHVAFYSLDKKLESYLERQFKLMGNKITVTHQEIADDLNSSREVISRLLKKMEIDKRITTSRYEITRLDF